MDDFAFFAKNFMSFNVIVLDGSSLDEASTKNFLMEFRMIVSCKESKRRTSFVTSAILRIVQNKQY